MPNPMTAELYAQLANAANAKKLAKNALNPYEPEFYGIQDRPMEHILNGEPQRYVPGTLEDEAGQNLYAKAVANEGYDASQPYGFSFGNFGGADFDVLGDGRSYSSETGSPIQDAGEGMVPSVDDSIWPEEGAVPAMLPALRTAGSMALPMLFSMLMRGGR